MLGVSSSSVFRPASASGGGVSADSVDGSHVLDGSIPAGDIAPGAVSVRSAPVFAGVDSSAGQVLWAPKTTDFTFEFSMRPTSTTQVNVMGRTSTFFPNVELFSGRDMRLRSSASDLADLEDVFEVGVASHFRIEWTATGATVWKDGAVIATPTWATQAWSLTPNQYYVGGRTISANTFEGELWGVRFIDPTDDTNTCVFPLDRANIGANTHSTSVVGDMNIAPTDIVDWVTVAGEPGEPLYAVQQTGLTRSQTNAGAGAQSTRLALRLSFQGAPNLVWARTGQTFGMAATVIHFGTAGALLGRQLALFPRLMVNANGTLEFRENATPLATSTYALPLGEATRIDTRWDSTSVELYVNGSLTETHTFGSVTWATSSANHGIGQQLTDTVMYDVDYDDFTAAANSATIALDGDFLNSRAGTSMGDATVPDEYEWVRVAKPGAGEPMAARETFVACYSMAAPKTGLAASFNLAVTTAQHEDDGFPTGASAAGTFEPGIAGVARWTVDAVISETGGTTDFVGSVFAANAVSVNYGAINDITVPMGTTKERQVSLTTTAVLTASGDNRLVRPRFRFVSGGTVTVDTCQVTIEFTPDVPQ